MTFVSSALKPSVIVVGGGIIGVTTAFELRRRGCETILLEASDEIACGTSFANGALLTPSMSDPWNTPGVYRHLIRSLSGRSAPIRLPLSAIPAIAGWGIRFLRNSSRRKHAATTAASFALAEFSLRRTKELAQELGLDFDQVGSGALKTFRDDAALRSAVAQAERLAELGLRYEQLGQRDLVRMEPALADVAAQLAGGIYFPDDMVGDARKFAVAVASEFTTRSGTLLTGCRATSIVTRGGRAVGVVTNKDGIIHADAIVVATGCAAPQLVPTGHLPIRPVKGYTLTFARPSGEWPKIPLVDDARHIVVVPLGDKLRLAGLAEFAGDDESIRDVRLEELRQGFADLLPRIACEYTNEDGVAWAGLRPMSSDGLPFIGATRTEGLYVNAGHGHLGWTCASGSAVLVADLLLGATPDIASAAYDGNR